MTATESVDRMTLNPLVYFHTAAALLHGRPDWSVYQHLADTDITEHVEVPTGDPGYSIPWEVLETKFHSLAVAVFDQQGRTRSRPPCTA